LKSRTRNNILVEIVKAEELVEEAEDLYNQELYTPSVHASYSSAIHASLAAHLTVGSPRPEKAPYYNLMAVLNKYSKKLEPYVERQMRETRSQGAGAGIEYDDKESLLRLYQTRELVVEIRDFIRRTVRF